MRNVAIELLRISTVGGVAVVARFSVSIDGGGGLSRPTSSSSLVHFSRPPLLAWLPPPAAASESLQSRGSPLESALDMLRFCGDMQTSGPLHSSDDDEDDEVEEAMLVAAAAAAAAAPAVVPVVVVAGGSGVRVATLPLL